jgi:WD40 repeat protein
MPIHRLAEITGHNAGVYGLAYDGTFIYSASADRYITRWNPTTGTQDNFAIAFDHPVYTICLVNDNQFLIAGLNTGDIHIFDLEKRMEIRCFKQHPSAIFSIIENPSTGQWYSADADGNLAVWSTHTHELLAFFPFNCGKIRRLALNNTGDLLALACQDGAFRILDTHFFNEVTKIPAHTDGTTAILFDPHMPSRIWTGGKDAMIRIWDWEKGQLINEIPAHNFVVYDLVTNQTGSIVISASRDKTLKVWDTETMSFLQRVDHKLAGHRHSVNVIIPLDTHKWVSASDDKRILIWSE